MRSKGYGVGGLRRRKIDEMSGGGDGGGGISDVGYPG